MKVVDCIKSSYTCVFEDGSKDTYFEERICNFKYVIESHTYFLATNNLSPNILYIYTDIRLILTNMIIPVINNKLRFCL